MTDPTLNERLADAREAVANRLKESQEMARDVAELCEKASQLSHRKSGSALPPATALSPRRQSSRQLKKENL